MVNPWHTTRRSVETFYNFYDPPSLVYSKIAQKTWPYRTRVNHFEMRDLALMGLLYMTCCRAGELTRAELTQKRGDAVIKIGSKKSITRDQFVFSENFVRIRKVPIIKRNKIKRNNVWVEINHVSDYPTRREISIPRVGGLSNFTDVIEIYLDTLKEDEELFKFRPCRAWQIVNYVTDEMPHYLRAMGLKLRYRLANMNIKDLQVFSGHQRIESLTKYLADGAMEENLLDYKEE